MLNGMGDERRGLEKNEWEELVKKIPWKYRWE